MRLRLPSFQPCWATWQCDLLHKSDGKMSASPRPNREGALLMLFLADHGTFRPARTSKLDLREFKRHHHSSVVFERLDDLGPNDHLLRRLRVRSSAAASGARTSTSGVRRSWAAGVAAEITRYAIPEAAGPDASDSGPRYRRRTYALTGLTRAAIGEWSGLCWPTVPRSFSRRSTLLPKRVPTRYSHLRPLGGSPSAARLRGRSGLAARGALGERTADRLTRRRCGLGWLAVS